jgi:hypothetical protein
MKKLIILFALFTCCFQLLSLNCVAQTPDWIWAKSPSTAHYYEDQGRSIVTDASGNSYITGYFVSHHLVFGSITLTNASDSTYIYPFDLFLVKYDINGNVLWAKSAGGKGDDEVFSAAINASGDIYVTGFFDSPVFPIGPDTLMCNGEYYTTIFLAKYDTSGNVLWAKSIRGGKYLDDGLTHFSSVAVDASGNAYLAGYFDTDSITFGGDTLKNAGGYTIFLAKYDAGGNVMWAKKAEGTSDMDFAYSVAADAQGNAYITGSFSDSLIIFGSTTLTNTNPYNQNVFLVKYDTYGNVLWAKCAGSMGSYDDQANSVAVDTSGNVYITGYFDSPILTFDFDTLIRGAGAHNIFLAKYDKNGNVLWAKNAVGLNIADASSVTVDAAENSYITGGFGPSTITFGFITLSATGTEDIFVAKYDPGGNVIWAKSDAGSVGDESGGLSIALDTLGNTYITGCFGNETYNGGDTITFGTTSLTNAGWSNTFIAKLYYNKIIDVINEQENSLNLSVYPNPTTNNLIIESPQSAVIEITDVQGQLIKTLTSTDNKTIIDVSAFASGVYFIKATTEKGVVIKKFIKE